MGLAINIVPYVQVSHPVVSCKIMQIIIIIVYLRQGYSTIQYNIYVVNVVVVNVLATAAAWKLLNKISGGCEGRPQRAPPPFTVI